MKTIAAVLAAAVMFFLGAAVGYARADWLRASEREQAERAYRLAVLGHDW